MVTEVDGKLVAEASDLGLHVGEWPPVLYLKDRGKFLVDKVERSKWIDGELIAQTYMHETTGQILEVYND